jgi:hypothetical protein
MAGRQVGSRYLHADTAAGSVYSGFDLLLLESDCVLCGAKPDQRLRLRGAYGGYHTTYLLRIEIPELALARDVCAVGLSSVSPGFDGLAAFRFLNGFTYGNFGDPGQFGLET